MKPLCGKKLSVCCIILSTWGVLQLAVMGIFFQIGATAFFHDIPHLGPFNDVEVIMKGYKTAAMNCWLAAVIYLVFLLLAISQYVCGQAHEQKMSKLEED